MDRNKTLHAYLRVSTQHQVDKDLSLPEQLALAQNYAEKHNLQLEVYEDAGKSAFDKDIESRPELMRLLDGIKKGNIRYVWVWNYNRLSREDEMNTLLNYTVASAGIEDLEIWIHDSNQSMKFDTLENKLMFQILQYQSSRASADLKTQMRRGHNSWLLKGGWPSPTLPYGYLTDKNRHLVINEEEAKVVREIFDLRIKEKLGYTSIANVLNKKGVHPRYKEGRKLASGENNRTTEGLTSGKWERSSIRNILLNELYYGQRIIVNNDWEKKGGKNVLKGQKEIFNENIKELAIISDETYKKAQSVNLGSRAVSNKGVYDALLKGLITCGDCGNSVRPWISPNRGSYLYRCTHNRNTYNNREDRCWSKGMNITMLNDLVYNSILSAESYQEVITELFDDKETKKQLKDFKKREELTQKELQDMKESLRRNEKLFSLGKINFERFEELNSESDEDVQKLERELADIRNTIDHLTDQTGHSEESRKMMKLINKHISNAKDVYDTSRLQYLKSSDPYFNAMKKLFNIVIDRIELKFHKEHNIHKVIITFKNTKTALNELTQLPQLNKTPPSKSEKNSFVTKTVNKLNPIDNRGLQTFFQPIHEYESLKKHFIDVPFNEPAEQPEEHDSTNPLGEFIPFDTIPKSTSKIPTVKVVYEYHLGNSRRKVDKMVFYSS